MSPYEIAVGLRYTRARRGSGRNSFISFIALTSMAGIALGVAALIVVLSVMNGFQDELRTRILSVASHIEIRGLPTLDDDPGIARTALANPHVKAAAPYVEGQAMLSAGEVNRGALIRGIDPAREDTVADIGRHMRAGDLGAASSRANSASSSAAISHARCVCAWATPWWSSRRRATSPRRERCRG